MPGNQQNFDALGFTDEELKAAPWLRVAVEELGVTETPGPTTTARIAEYLKTVGQAPDDEIPWCSAFVNWVVERAELDGTDKANARSWLGWGESLGSPRPGAITVLWRDSPNSWKGHVGFYVREVGSQVLLLGGNQGDRVALVGYSRSRVLEHRWAR